MFFPHIKIIFFFSDCFAQTNWNWYEMQLISIFCARTQRIDKKNKKKTARINRHKNIISSDGGGNSNDGHRHGDRPTCGCGDRGRRRQIEKEKSTDNVYRQANLRAGKTIWNEKVPEQQRAFRNGKVIERHRNTGKPLERFNSQTGTRINNIISAV